MSVSLKGFNEQVATFFMDDEVQKGDLVKISSDNLVKTCVNGEIPVGICVNANGSEAGVLLSGYVEVPYVGSLPSLGENNIIASDAKSVSESANGKKVLVVMADNETSTVGFIL